MERGRSELVKGNRGRWQCHSEHRLRRCPSASFSVCTRLQGRVARESALHVAVERLVVGRSHPAKPQVQGGGGEHWCENKVSAEWPPMQCTFPKARHSRDGPPLIAVVAARPDDSLQDGGGLLHGARGDGHARSCSRRRHGRALHHGALLHHLRHHHLGQGHARREHHPWRHRHAGLHAHGRQPREPWRVCRMHWCLGRCWRWGRGRRGGRRGWWRRWLIWGSSRLGTRLHGITECAAQFGPK